MIGISDAAHGATQTRGLNVITIEPGCEIVGAVRVKNAAFRRGPVRQGRAPGCKLQGCVETLRQGNHPDKGLASSFKLDPEQMTVLIRQTGSSFYLFQCPGLLDRGVPMIPTQLVEDLARYHAASAAQIPADLVGPASRPFAEWLTYMVLGLRTGDPLAELVL